MMTNRSDSIRLRTTAHPLLYEVNTRLLVNELSAAAGRKITLATIPDKVLDEWTDLGFDAVWLMGVWGTGNRGLEIARTFPALQEEYRKTLPDCGPADVIGSPYAVKSYTVSRALGGNQALVALRRRLEKRGLGLVLDFICNHTARDHPWVARNPEYYVNGTDGDEQQHPDLYFRTATVGGQKILAFGRDPTFPGWTDTAQLNHLHPELRVRMLETLLKIAGLCDGVRCDMAMLILRSVFERTWGDRAKPADTSPAEGEFWQVAIDATKARYPEFLFLAESYWDMEWQLQELGFDYTYDKRLYDRLLREGASSVYDHLCADEGFQRKSIRFIENHDELRAAHSLPSPLWNCAAATIMSTVPGMALFHEGQIQGRMIRVPVQLGRRPVENESSLLDGFYRRLLQCLNSSVFRLGGWTLLSAKAAWHENSTWRNFLAFWWDGGLDGCRLVVVNYAPHNSQSYVVVPFKGSGGGSVELRDLLGPSVYYREHSVLTTKGMFFDLSPYVVHIFEVKPAK